MPSRRRRYRHRPKIQPKKPPANREIPFENIRVVGSQGAQLGIMPTRQALTLAEDEGLDLVVVAQKTDPPVARIMDLGKYMYEQRKKQMKQKARNKGKDIKGIRIGFKTDKHDWDVRLRQASNFLERGHKVKLDVRLRGREWQQRQMAEQKMRDFMAQIPGGAEAEQSITRAQYGLSILLTRP